MIDSEVPWEIWFDGSAAPNPGRIGIGALVVSPAGERHEISRPLGRSGCNNEAELRALAAALDAARDAGATRLLIHGDSRFVIDCLSGHDRTEVPHLAAVIAVLEAQLAAVTGWELRWLPRHRNTTADRLARTALGLPEKLPQKAKRRK